jgi:O-antigen/teichoic acid export membrane protein
MATMIRPATAKPGVAMVGVTTLVFLASKATAFLAPMLLARSMPVQDYGTIELALAWGTPSAILVGLGLHGAVPYFLLKLNRPESRRVFFLHAGMVCLVLAALAAVLRVAPLPAVVAFALLITAIFCAQNIYAALLKTESHPAAASAVEVGVYCVLFLLAGLFALAHIPVRMEQVFAILLAIVLLFAGLSASLFRRAIVRHGLAAAYRDSLNYGMAIILSAVLGTLLMSGGRILIGALLGVADVAIFSLLFRMAAAAVLMHQLTATMIFPKLYQLEPKRLNYVLVGIQGLVLAASITVAVAGLPIGRSFLPLLRTSSAPVHQILTAVCIQMFYWCVAAQCEFIFYRENLGVLYAKLLGVVFALLVAGSYALKFLGSATLLSLANWQLTVTFIATIGALLLLWRRSVRLPFPLLLSCAVFVAYWGQHAVYSLARTSH